jgi:DNA polymerase (family 10)
MPVYNSDVANILNRVADLLEIEGANEFRVRAYRNAARTISTLSDNIADRVEEGEDLTEMEGIGEDLAAKIEEIVKTGDLKQLEEIEQRTPPALAAMLDIAGLGPKRVQKLYKQLDITSMDELRQAAENHRIRELEGLGPTIEEKVLDDLEEMDQQEARTQLNVAEELVGPLVAYLEEIEGVKRVAVAGSYRRRKETVGDLDILATGSEGERIIDRFVTYEDVETVLSQGETRSSVELRTGLQVDLRVVSEESYGAALLYFTGSKAHNIALRNMALDRDLKINEYGVYRDEERNAGETEEEIYGLFDLPVIEPELREDRGEIEAALNEALPNLITLEDIRGDLQMHTQASDGHDTLRAMAEAARDLGYAYIAITDHSARVAVTQGLDADSLSRRIDEIDQLNEEMEDLRILKGIEVDILEDGSLDLPDEALERLDLVIAAVHVKFDLPREEQTERIIRAMDNPRVHILAHPTGRILGERQPYELDMERLMEAAAERGCALELNAHPDRLDLNDIHCKMAKALGVKIAISTDAHRVDHLRMMRYGVGQARRGWLEPEDVINTRSWSDLSDLLKR